MRKELTPPRNETNLVLSIYLPCFLTLERRKEEEKQRKEEEKRRKEEEEAKRRKEEDLKRRREEEVKRRREVVAVARVCKQSKVSSATTSEEEESNGGRGPRSRKFLNLFSASSSSPYCSTGGLTCRYSLTLRQSPLSF